MFATRRDRTMPQQTCHLTPRLKSHHLYGVPPAEQSSDNKQFGFLSLTSRLFWEGRSGGGEVRQCWRTGVPVLWVPCYTSTLYVRRSTRIVFVDHKMHTYIGRVYDLSRWRPKDATPPLPWHHHSLQTPCTPLPVCVWGEGGSACVRVCVWECVRACVCVCVFI